MGCGCNECTGTAVTVGAKGDPGATGTTGATGATGLGILPIIDGTTATIALVASDTGSFILLDRPTGIVVTLPSSPPDGTIYTFQIAQSASGGTYVINVNGAGLDTIAGFVYMNKASTAPALFTATVGVATQIAMNETTTGGLVGGNFTLVFNANKWYTSGDLFGSGAVSTPFS